MLWIFKRIRDRIKTLLIADAAGDLEAELLDHHAERKADLLRKAQDYQEKGMESLAEELRERAAGLSIEKPLISPAIGKLAENDSDGQISHPENSPDEPKRIASKKPSKTKAAKVKKGRRTKAR